MDITVLVAGAGPTGLTLGIELARRGVPVRVVDRAERPAVGSRGDGLQPRTLEVFDDIGVLGAVLAAGAPHAPIRAYADGRFVGERRMSEWREPTPDVPLPNPWVLGQAQTEEILRTRLGELGIRVELGTELTAFAQDGERVTATLRRDGRGETVRADYLVGADGGRSAVRRALGIAFTGSTVDELRMLAADVTVPGLDHEHGHWFAGADDLRAGISLTPLPGGELFQVACAADPARDDDPAAVLQATLDRFCGPQLRDVAWASVWRPNARLAQRYRQGRVFLAGDAAHVHPPTGGQGLNTGVQDAYNLGWKLAEALRTDAPDELLDSYEAERLPVAARVLGLSTALLRKHTDGAADAHVRGSETHQLDVGYRHSPLVSDARSVPGRLRAGDRAPDAPVVDAAGRAVRLFDLFRGPHATVLAFGGGATTSMSTAGAPVHAVLRPGRRASGPAMVDVDGHAFAAYDVTEGTSVLVRPDGYVGAVELDTVGAGRAVDS